MTAASDRRTTVTYQYDALGRRVSRLARGQGGNTRFTYQGADVVVEDNDGTQTKYLNGLGVDNKLRVQTGNDVKYFLSDHLGSTTALTDATGSVTASNSYDSFGNATNSAFPSRYQFTGREYDSFTGLTNFRARWLDPKLGRFISADPIGLSGGINQFTYVGNNPINATDPSGLYEVDVHYWLTLFLASKNTCYSPEVADQIAASDQGVDTNPATSPGLGKIEQNIKYHALTPYSYEGKRNWVLWADALSGGGSELGIYLHNLQDTYSHAGYSNSFGGHALLRDDWLAGSDEGWGADLDAADKTYKDVAKTMRMAYATWSNLNEYAQKRCNCRGPSWNNEWFDQIKRFAEVPVGPFPRLASIEGELPVVGKWSGLADSDSLARKIRILFP